MTQYMKNEHVAYLKRIQKIVSTSGKDSKIPMKGHLILNITNIEKKEHFYLFMSLSRSFLMKCEIAKEFYLCQFI